MARNNDSGWSRRWSAVLAFVIVLGGLAVSLGLAAHLRSDQHRTAELRMISTSETLQNTVSDQLSAYLDTVRSAAAGLTAMRSPTKAGFTEITSAIGAQQLPAVSAVRFLAPATPGELGTVAQSWRLRGADGLTIAPVPDAPHHLFTVFSRGLNGGPAPAPGVDQAAAPAEDDVTRLARTTRDVAISDAYALLGDAGPAEPSFDVVAPVYGGGKRVLIGYLALSVRGTDFLTASRSAASGRLLDAELLTRSASGVLTQVARVSENRAEDVRRAQDIRSGQRQWVLRTTAATGELLPNTTRTDLAVLLAGGVLAVLLGVLVYLKMASTARTRDKAGLEVAAAGPREDNPEVRPDVMSSTGLPRPGTAGSEAPGARTAATGAAEQTTWGGATAQTARADSAEWTTSADTAARTDSAAPTIGTGSAEWTAPAGTAAPTARTDSATWTTRTDSATRSAPAAGTPTARTGSATWTTTGLPEAAGPDSAARQAAGADGHDVDSATDDGAPLRFAGDHAGATRPDTTHHRATRRRAGRPGAGPGHAFAIEGDVESAAETTEDDAPPRPVESYGEIVTIEGELVLEATLVEPEPEPAGDATEESADGGDAERPPVRRSTRRRSTADGAPDPAAEQRAVRGRRPRKATQPTAAPKEITEPAPRPKTSRPRRNVQPTRSPAPGPGHAEADNVAETLRQETGRTANPLAYRPS